MATGVTTWWNGNGQSLAQTETLTVTAVATGGTATATMNGKSLTYTALNTDTTATFAAAWKAILANVSTAPPEFSEQSYSVTNNIITVTADTLGQPYTLTISTAGGVTVSQATTQANQSQSDVFAGSNWLRGGVPGLPQNGDDVVVANSTIPLLWNLDKLAAIQFNSFTRWQSFTGTIGLPEFNPNGYWEYRPTYFQFSGPPLGNLNVLLGQGFTGSGPGRERYNVGGQLTTFNVIQSGSALDTYAVRLLGSNGGNAIQQKASSVGVAMLTGEVAALASAVVDGAGTLALGSGVQYGSSITSSAAGSSSASSAGLGSVTAIGATVLLFSAPGSVVIDQASQAFVQGVGLTYPFFQASGASYVTWVSSSGVTQLVLTGGSIFDKSQDVQKMSVAACNIDASTCQILDPNNAITFLSPIVLNEALRSGPIQLGRGRKLLPS